jgi:hypothetical protein
MQLNLIANKGRAAAESAMSEGGKAFESLVSFKSGTTYVVRVPSLNDFVEYFCHSVFKVFYSTVCTRTAGKDDLYDKAVALLYDDANRAKDAENEELAKELRDQAYQLKAKPRYLFGFFNLDDGEPILIDVSKKQAQALITAIDKYEKRVDLMAFELSKTGSGTGTTVNLLPMLEDLSTTHQKNFEATKGKEFPGDLYGKVLYAKDESKQVEDLVKFGFDVSRLGITAGGNGATPIDDTIEFNEDDIPF